MGFSALRLIYLNVRTGEPQSTTVKTFDGAENLSSQEQPFVLILWSH